ncbi:aldehyde dehydrogenase family protein [Photobacterium indicum]|uniref:aldehyde dehydrogenase family protein n=1 Tax=Photobacterium indicum TaxID=81447 RepID=UPI003D0FD576
MTTNIQTMVDSSLSTWESWNGLGYSERTAILTQWASQLEANAKLMVEFQCRNALEHVGETLLMPGPTGETNELYSAGRGAFVVTADADATVTAIVGQITAVLVTGNTLFICLPADSALSGKALVSQLEKAGCPHGVIVAVDCDQLADLVSHTSIAGVAYAGELSTSQAMARQLATRDGLLAQLVTEIDCELLPVIGSPTYILHFVTERTRTINITAVGGNATLLELGSGEH